MKKTLAALAVVLGLSTFAFIAPVEAQGIWGGCDPSASNEICGDTTQAEDIAKRIINTFLFVIGALSVIMIIHSGLKYVTSRGDAEQVKSAKNTLLYAVIGLIVALLSFTIVNFVVETFVEDQPPVQGPPAPAPPPVQGPPAP